MPKTICIGKKAPLIQDIVFIEGITRSGKFLLANLLAGFDGIEPVQTCRLMEMIPVFTRFGFIERTTAKELLRCESDLHCYEMYIGRNLNQRRSDKSSIFHHPRSQAFVKRCTMSDGDAALQRFYREKPRSLFILHETMPNIEIYFEIFPTLQIVHLTRSPMDLVFSLSKRGLGRRAGSDPRFWMIPFKENKKSFPWYFYPRQKEYFTISEFDRVALRIINLFALYKKKRMHLPAKYAKKIINVAFECLMRDPKKEIRRIADFLGENPSVHMTKILQQEKLPNKGYFNTQAEKIAAIKKTISPQYFAVLSKLQKEYLGHLN